MKPWPSTNILQNDGETSESIIFIRKPLRVLIWEVENRTDYVIAIIQNILAAKFVHFFLTLAIKKGIIVTL